jgi:glycosyltransferase involved in cell wall biosynthesis
MFCSIIIPLYNKADFIAEAIQSVLDQSHQNFEVIVVDDGSIDDSAKRVRAIPDQRVKLIQQTNSGVSCARNAGIEQANGDLVFFLDADDWYLPTYLETIVSMALQYPEIAFFATNFKNVSDNNLDQTSMFWDPGDTSCVEFIDDLFQRWRIDPIFVTNSVAIRRTALINFKPCFPPGEQWGEDQDLWFRLAEKFRLAYCPAPLVGYRKAVDGSLCAIHEPRTLKPAYFRLEQRAFNRQMSDSLRSSAIKLVTEAKITVARNLMADGRRFDAFMLLLKIQHAINSKRWWVSMIMCLVATPTLVRRWENWRHYRKRNW